MANTADKVINIARQEVGYLEKKDGNLAYLHSKTANAGYNNFTKYGFEMHQIYPGIMDYPAAWCDAFVDWCFYKAYGTATAKKLLGGNFDDYTVSSAQMYQKMGAIHTIPVAGDQVFYTRNGSVSGCYHTGIVESVDGDTFFTIEGNTSGSSGIVANGGGVFRKKRGLRSLKGKVIFGRPSYDTATSKSKVRTTRAANLQPARSFDKSAAKGKKLAVVTNTDPLAMRTGPGKDYDLIISIPKGDKVTWYGYYTDNLGVRWYLVTYDSRTGYCSGHYLR